MYQNWNITQVFRFYFFKYWYLISRVIHSTGAIVPIGLFKNFFYIEAILFFQNFIFCMTLFFTLNVCFAEYFPRLDLFVWQLELFVNFQ